MSLSSSSTISIINVSQGLSGLMADVSRAFFICYQEYTATGTPLDEETTTGVELEEGSLTPLNDSLSIPAIFQDPQVIQEILNDPSIGGLKLVVFEWGVLDQNRSSAVFLIANLQPYIPAATSTGYHPHNLPVEEQHQLMWMPRYPSYAPSWYLVR
ncbi:hypothetical protein N7499_002871 [Penicillium canescens]|uniref:Uncharacterized protein n=1 Tax=Penicillium canescens TaxID=5083 RepID=A0AAD6N5Z9_PENCN|nr:hypothetical protein N7522_013549 [Penicillium canescens]KAJ6018453.1 hypothetical protein N7522_001917 [Penicillium canescens]KAJ6034087.1 hypothetical protein N7460_009904 [Penicillium canescens]KAJ6039265.1 hypothetical protein N7460_007297 [Penicillium canescens]KAJ6060943.1 hypothetical protein N7444_002797 [Penicillium canescens]